MALIEAPAFCGDMEAYSLTIWRQAEAFASEFGLELLNTYPELARRGGKSTIHLGSEYRSTQEMLKELSSDPRVISVQANYLFGIEPPPKSSGGCNAGFGSIPLLLVGIVLLAINRKKSRIIRKS